MSKLGTLASVGRDKGSDDQWGERPMVFGVFVRY